MKMVANGVLISFDVGLLLSVGGIVIAGYASYWAIPRIIAFFH